MKNYDELKATATELLGAGWNTEEKADILSQHDDLNYTEAEWEKIFSIMEDLEETATYRVLPMHYDDFGATEDNDTCTLRDLRSFARSWDKPLGEVMDMVTLEAFNDEV